MQAPPCISLFLLWLLPATLHAQLVLVPNTTLNFPSNLPTESTGYTSENAFGSLTFSLPIAIRNVPGQSSHVFVVQRNASIELVGADVIFGRYSGAWHHRLISTSPPG